MAAILDAIIEHAIRFRASDIHIKVGAAPIYRIDGLICHSDLPPVQEEGLQSIFSMLKVNVRDLEARKQTDTSFQMNNIRFRVHAYETSSGYSVALRPIPVRIPSPIELELPEIVSSFQDYTDGLILITGATGSGKSTTLASIIQQINLTARKHIITIEHPIEFIFSEGKCLVDQREIGTNVTDFTDAISGAMREDPDIVLIGEMRDLETMKLALTLAETGHLVFGTLHSKNVPETPERIIDVFPEAQQNQIRLQLANTLQAVVNQRLVPRLGGGRVPVCEVMVLNNALRGMIRSKVAPNAIRDELNSNKQCQTRTQSVVNLFLKNKIDLETALAYSEEKEEILLKMIRGK